MQITIIDFDQNNPAHAKYFSDLNREWLEKYFYVEPEDEIALSSPVQTVIAKGGVILFALANDIIVGTGSILKLPDGSAEIAKMAVTEAHQGQGIGRQLLQALIARVKMMQVAKCFIVSNTSLAPAIMLYRTHGFVDSAENRHSHYARGDITLELALTRA